ncbi:MAG: response regulator transcription factor [Candidatus Limnocylindria bacterium]
MLVIEDDSDLRRLLRRGLEEEGFEVIQASLGKDAVALAEGDPPDLLVVDIGLPDADGRDVVQAVRSHGVDSPVLFLTARDQMVDRLAGFSAGGDDYLTKPFEFAELIARLRALHRRSAGRAPAVAAGDLRLDPAIHAVTSGEKTVPLTPTEFRLLGALVGRHGETVRRRELIATGWPDGAIVHDNTLDVYLGRLRKKLAELPTDLKIDTAHGVGYRLR